MTTKQYTIQDFNRRKLPENMVVTEWDDFFAFMKSQIKPCGTKYMPTPRSEAINSNREYHGETEAWRYRNFINDILKSVRHGKIDYCFYVFQVRDLLKYEPRITVRYLENANCFCVSYEE